MTAPQASSESGGSRRTELSPFRDEAQIHRAIKRFSQRNTKSGERKQILARLRATGPKAAAGACGLLEVFPRQDISTRHAILDLIREILEMKGDLSEAAPELAKYLNHANYGLREKVGKMLIAMGPDANEAIGRVLGCTRHAMVDVRRLAVQVIAACGPVCAPAALPRLRKMAQNTPDTEGALREDIQAALDALAVAVPASGRPARGDEASTSTRRILKQVHRASQVPKKSEPSVVEEARERLAELPEEKRIRALLLGLKAEAAGARAMAARILESEWRHLPEHVQEIEEAHARETDAHARDRMANLLTILAMHCPDRIAEPSQPTLPPDEAQGGET